MARRGSGDDHGVRAKNHNHHLADIAPFPLGDIAGVSFPGTVSVDEPESDIAER